MGEINSYMQATILQYEVTQPAGAALLFARLFRVHQDHKTGSCLERLDQPAEAHGFGTIADMTVLAVVCLVIAFFIEIVL